MADLADMALDLEAGADSLGGGARAHPLTSASVPQSVHNSRQAFRNSITSQPSTTNGAGIGGLSEELAPSRGQSQQSSSLQYSGGSLVGSKLLESELPDLYFQKSFSAPKQSYEDKVAQRSDIMNFSSMATMDYGAVTKPPVSPTPEEDDEDEDSSILSIEAEVKFQVADYQDSVHDENAALLERLPTFFDPTLWLTRDAKVDEQGNLYFSKRSEWSIAGFFRYLFYNPLSPEFTSLQQFSWALVIGVMMGVYTAFWKTLIEGGLDFVWEDIPEFLQEVGVFTDKDGIFPLYHYMWMCPAVFGGVLSYIFAVVKIPDQNEWINSVHSLGVQDHTQFAALFILSTLGMLSGLSLGPELPLVLTAGMVGSYLGLLCKQSMLQARVMNLTAAGAAVGGFFGFPMAGALFVMELPHRMGLQYFEALSPATISSIVAVLVNRIVTGNEVTGYYSYPFLTSTLPSSIFTHAIVYGLFGAAVGILYAIAVIKLKTNVHDWFHASHDHHDPVPEKEAVEVLKGDEMSPLLGAPRKRTDSFTPVFERLSFCVIKHEPYRAAVAGMCAGAIAGTIGIFVPHTVFWGEAQLQNLIDRGRTPLPVFGTGDAPTAAFTSLAFCMIDPTDPNAIQAGFSVGCSALISVAKVVHIGLSLGTGIIGGHFWGPLFVGCSASHFLTDVVNMFADKFGFGRALAMYPCVVILCTMGSSHVVTFRAHMAIMLILTLTISAFDPENDVNAAVKVAGDYSAVFPLLVVSVFVSLMVSRQTVFYKTQRSRGDIMAIPEVLCEPGLVGRPMVVGFESGRDGDDDPDMDELGVEVEDDQPTDLPIPQEIPAPRQALTQKDIEAEFQASTARTLGGSRISHPPALHRSGPPTPPSTAPSTIDGLAGLDDLLSKPIETNPIMSSNAAGSEKRRHRRIQSAPVAPRDASPAPPPVARGLERQGSGRFVGNRERSNSQTSKESLVRVESYGEIQQHQPSLMDQARARAATSDRSHRRVPSLPSAGMETGRHRRVPSLPSARSPRIPSAIGGEISEKSVDGKLLPVVNSKIGGEAFSSSWSTRLWTDSGSETGSNA